MSQVPVVAIPINAHVLYNLLAVLTFKMLKKAYLLMLHVTGFGRPIRSQIFLHFEKYLYTFNRAVIILSLSILVCRLLSTAQIETAKTFSTALSVNQEGFAHISFNWSMHILTWPK